MKSKTQSKGHITPLYGGGIRGRGRFFFFFLLSLLTLNFGVKGYWKIKSYSFQRLQRKAIPLLSGCVLPLMVLMIRTAMHVEETSSFIVPDTWVLCTISPPIFLSPMLRGDASRQVQLCSRKSKPSATRVRSPSCFMLINNLDQ